MRAIITKDVVGDNGPVFTVGQIVEGGLMQHTAPDEQWADCGDFIVKVGGLEYAIDCAYFKRPIWMRIGDFINKYRK